MDTGTHLHAIWHRRWRVLAAALLVGGLVFALRAAAPATYTTDAGLFLVRAQGTAAGDDSEVARLTAAYVELVFDAGVADDATRRNGGRLSVEELRRRVEVTSASDGEITVAGEGPTPTAAATLANAVADALSAGARRDQAEALRRELLPLDTEIAALERQIAALPDDSPRIGLLRGQQERAQSARLDRLVSARARLDVVRRAKPIDAERRPDALRDALLAFLLTAIVAAELAAVRAARRQGLEMGDPLLTLETWTSLPVFRLSDEGDTDQRAAALRFLDAGGGPEGRVLHLAPLDPTRATTEGLALLVDAVAERYGAATWVALDSPTPPLAREGVQVVQPATAELAGLPARNGGAPVVVTAPAWESSELIAAADLLPGTCLLLVDTSTARRPDVEEALRVLAYAGIPPALVLAVTPRSWRRPGRSSRETAAEASPVSSAAA